MGLADLSLKDARGHTVLHVAARRKEPAVLVTLLSKRACASETTSDGPTAVAICGRMTRRNDYIEATKQGQETNKDRLRIDVLEREMRRNSMSGNLALSSEVMADDFQMKLNYLENRVSFAWWLFPSEARIAMDIADADATNFCTGLSASKSKGSSGNLKEVDLNETPSMQARRLHCLKQLWRVDTTSLIAKSLRSLWIVIGLLFWNLVLWKSRNLKGLASTCRRHSARTWLLTIVQGHHHPHRRPHPHFTSTWLRTIDQVRRHPRY